LTKANEVNEGTNDSLRETGLFVIPLARWIVYKRVVETKDQELGSAEQQINSDIRRLKKCAWVLFAAGCAAGIYGLFKFSWTDPAQLANLGSFLQGTTVGLWGLAGILLIYIAFLGQKLALFFQAEQLRLAKQELDRQESQLAAQNEVTNRQNFESAFFQLLRLHHEIVNAMEQGKVKGRALFQEWHREMKSPFFAKFEETTSPEEAANLAYSLVYARNQSELAHYFRNLYHIFKFIKRSPIGNKKDYTSIVRAQLSAYELALLHYNCKTESGNKFFDLLQEFELLENMNRELLYEKRYARGATETVKR
jgi:hypothetical protein